MGIVLWLVVVIAPLALVVMLLVRRRPLRELQIDEGLMPTASSTAARIRARNLVALAAAAAVAVLLVGPGSGADMGRTLLLAPLVTATVAIAFFIVVPAFRFTGEQRSAELTPRSWLSFTPGREIVLPVALTLAVVAACLAFGAVADADGRSFSYRQLERGFGGSPFPGFYYGVPILVGVAILVVVSVVVIWRIGQARMPSDPSLREADSAVRQLAVRVIVRAASAALAVTLGGMMLIASTASSGGGSWSDDPNVSGALEPDPFMQTLPVVENVLAIVLLLGALALAISAITNAVRKPVTFATVVA